MLKSSANQVIQIVSIQFAATMILSVFVMIFDRNYAASALAGGLIASFANAYFAWKVFGRQQQSEPEQILANYYSAEVGKIILTVLMFVGAIVSIKPLSMIILLGVFVLNTLIPLLASFFINDDGMNWRAKNVR